MKKGFTLVELLAVIAIIILLSLLLTPKINSIIEENRVKGYKEIENRITNAAQKYLLEQYISSDATSTIITKQQLINAGYIDEIKDIKSNNICDANIIVSNIQTKPKFVSSLSCDNYSSGVGQAINLVVNLDGGLITTNPAGNHFQSENISLVNPTKSGYQFSHWSIESGNSAISGNNLYVGSTATTIKANWFIGINLTVNLDGGLITTNPAGNHFQSENIFLVNPTKSGYQFSHWSVESGNSIISGNNLYIGSTPTTIKANWKKAIVLTVNLDGGTIDDNPAGIVLENHTIRLGIPTKANARFSHWSIESGNSTMSGNNLNIGTTATTIKANWRSFILTFDANGGNVNPSNKIITGYTYGELPIPTKTNYTFVGWYTAINNGEKILSTTSFNILENQTLYAHWIMTSTSFRYTGNSQIFDVLETGYYKLETWGASGGNKGSVLGGAGGYSSAIFKLYKETSLYVIVGGEGISNCTATCNGGYNGGGNSTATYHGSGGGATHIATSSGLLAELNTNKLSILLVAGGGGGASNYNATNTIHPGGAGGGLVGIDGHYLSSYTTYNGHGGTQTTGGTCSNCAAGSFGQGGFKTSGSYCGGGGGYYGGACGWGSSGGGGSSYVSNTRLAGTFVNISGLEKIPSKNDYSSSTIGNVGDGFAKITFIGNTDERNIIDIDYSGVTESFTVEKTGKYKLEAWGAQGGNYNASYHGGYGGYSSGNINLTAGQTIYITVGEKPIDVTAKVAVTGGYNGGGNAAYRSDVVMEAGGGATHIATTFDGLLSTLTENDNSSILIVAGGGGGGTYYNATRNGLGGNGGGIQGTDGYYSTGSNCESYGLGGTQSAGGGITYYSGSGVPGVSSFGLGGAGATSGGGPGGGGGYYGGGGGYCIGGGGGGSGYIGNLISGTRQMYTYCTSDCENYKSTADETKTNVGNCVNKNAISNCSKLGNGHVRITYLGE